MGRIIESIERVRGRLYAHRRYDPRLFQNPPPRFEVAGRRVLLAYPFSGLGDALLLAPVVRALCDCAPQEPVGLLLPPFAAKVWKTIDLRVRLHVLAEDIDRDRVRKKRLEREIARSKYDIAVDLGLREEIDVRKWLAASGAAIRVGWVREGERLAALGLDFGAPDVRRETIHHWSRYTALPLACFGVERPRFDVPWRKDRSLERRAEAFWEKDRRPRLFLVPGTRAEHKRVDRSRFVSIGRAASERWGARIVVSGSPSEAKMLRSVAKAIGDRAKIYAGRDLGLLRALIASAEVVVSNDTGPMHFAFLLGKPTIAFFSYMPPAVWGPPKTDPRFVVLNARAGHAIDPDDDGEDAWSRVALHHLGRLIENFTRKIR